MMVCGITSVDDTLEQESKNHKYPSAITVFLIHRTEKKQLARSSNVSLNFICEEAET